MDKFSSEQITQLQEIGSYLRQRRVEQSVSLKQVSLRTQIRSEVLKALEDGEVAYLPEPVYTRNLIRHYGNALRIDGEALANAFPYSAAPVVLQNWQQSTQGSGGGFKQDQTSRRSTRIGIYILCLFLVVGLAYGVFFLLNRLPANEEPSEKPASAVLGRNSV